MIKSLELVNWKSHASTKLTFGTGTNLFIGSMGSGKTSCVEAICFALYGTFPLLKSHKISLEDVIKNAEKNARIKVEFIAPDENTYFVERTVTINGGEATLRDSHGNLLEGPQPKRTSEAVQSLLKIDYDLFTRAIYSEQNKIDHFINLPKGERKKQLDSLLGLDSFEFARANAVTLINSLKSQKYSVQAQLDSAKPSEVSSEKAFVENELKLTASQFEAASKQLSALNAELTCEKEKLEKLEKNKTLYMKLQSLIQTAKAQAAALNAQGSTLSKMEVTKEQALKMQEVTLKTLFSIKQLNSKLFEVENAKNKLEGQIATLESQNIDFNQNALQNESKALEEIQIENSSLNAQLKALQEQLSIAAAQVKILTAQHFEYQRVKKELEPKLMQNYEFCAEYTSIDALNGKISALEIRKANATQEQSTLDAHLETLKTAVKQLSKETPRCPTCDSTLSNSQKELVKNEKEKTMKKIQKDLQILTQTQTTINSELANLNIDKNKWQSTLPFLATQLPEVNQEALNQAKHLLAKLIRQVEFTTEQLSQKQTIYTEQQLRVSKLKQQKQNLEILEKLKVQKTQKTNELNAFAMQLQVLGSQEEQHAQLQFLQDHLKRLDLEFKAFEELKRVKNLETQMSQVKYDEETHSATSAKVREVELNSTRIQEKQQSQHFQKKELEKQLEKLKIQAEQIEKLKTQLTNVQNSIHQLTIYSTALMQTQEALRAELISAINEALKAIWLEVYPYFDYTCIQLTPSKTDYEIQIKKLNNEWTGIEKTSGGERTCAALSLRVALSMVLAPNLSWLVLDEPTHNLDANAISLLTRALHDSIPNIVRQTFIITHDEKLKEAATATTYKFERNKNANLPTTTEQVS